MRPRVALLWWESVRLGWGTVGDFYAVHHVRQRLLQRGAEVDVVWDHAWPYGGAVTVSPSAAAGKPYDAVAFVCGPLVARDEFVDLLDMFGSVRKVAVGVSVIDGHERATRLFDRVYARDHGRSATFDLSLDPRGFEPPLETPRPRPEIVGLTLVHDQAEYGAGRTRAAQVEEACGALGRRHGCALTPIPTQRPLTAASLRGFSQELLNTRVVLTNRLHGALMAIAHERPALVVDHVPGGGKVTAVLRRIDYPFLFSVDDLDVDRLDQAFAQCQQPSFAEPLQEMKRHAQALSVAAVDASVALILE